VRRLVLLLVAAAIAALMLSLLASPAMAFIDETLPAGSCPQPALHEAADNETAFRAIEFKNPVKGPLLMSDKPIVNTPAPDECPAR
jgi:hypothetical protein